MRAFFDPVAAFHEQNLARRSERQAFAQPHPESLGSACPQLKDATLSESLHDRRQRLKRSRVVALSASNNDMCADD